MTPFHSESQRYDYPLTVGSTICDVGAYKGDFAAAMATKYNCTVHAFEPVEAFFEQLRARPELQRPNVHLHNFGWAAETTLVPFVIADDSTNAVGYGRVDQPRQACTVRRAAGVLQELNLMEVSLLKLNIEGLEYAVLEHLLDEGLLARVQYLQVQYHAFGCPDPAARRDAIRERLATTHEEMWCEPFVWEAWSRR